MMDLFDVSLLKPNETMEEFCLSLFDKFCPEVDSTDMTNEEKLYRLYDELAQLDKLITSYRLMLKKVID